MRSIKKVLYIPHWYPDRYDEQFGVFLQKHARAIALQAQVVVIYVHSDAHENCSSHVEIFHNANLTEYICYYKKNKSSFLPIRFLINGFRYLSGMKKGLTYAWKQIGKPDICHACILTRPVIIATFLKLFFGISFVITEEWTGYGSGAFKQKWWLDRLSAHFFSAQANSILTVSSSLKNNMSNCDFNNNFHIIGNVVEDVEPQLPRKSGSINIINIADHVDWKKGITDLIKAVKNIEKTKPDIILHLIGDGPDHELICKVAKESGLIEKNKLIIYGRKFNDFVYQLMPKMDFLVVNSTFETFSVATAEALVAGKPVIVTRCGGPEEFVTEDMGIVIDHSAPIQLENAIVKMMDSCRSYNPKKLSQYTKSKFSYSKVGERIHKIYQTGK